MTAKNICNFESKVQAVFTELGYAQNTISQILFITKKLIRLHNEQNEKELNGDIIANHVKHQEMRYLNKEISKQQYLWHKTITEYLSQICDTGTIVYKKRKWLPPLPDYFENILANMLNNEKWTVKNRKHQYKHSSTFFRWLCTHGYTDLSCVDEKIVHDYLIDCSKRMVGISLNNTSKALKVLFQCISEDGNLSEQMNRLFLFKARVETGIKPFMPQDEIAAVLNVIDQSTAKGKRDYAMIILASVTGLRGIDIANLSLDSVDWRNGEIRIVQEKTGVVLALPLTTDVGKSIQEYILNARPSSQSNKVFLSVKAPYNEIGTAALQRSLEKYCIKARLSHRSPHSLRRGIATSMVTSGVSVITVAQALGHKTIGSTKQYISLDSRNLKECALDFSGIQIGGDVL